MRRLALVALASAGLGLTLAAGATGEPSDSQKTFTQALLDDKGTSAGVKRLLRTQAGIVSPSSGFVDVTGDGRQDALVLVSTNGAAGNVALYVFSTHGQTGDNTKLKVIFSVQSLYRATLRISGTTLSILEPHWTAGDDLCCPSKLRERDYRFVPSRTVFRRVADHDVPFM